MVEDGGVVVVWVVDTRTNAVVSLRMDVGVVRGSVYVRTDEDDVVVRGTKGQRVVVVHEAGGRGP